ncbi:MAG: hypothetical protein DA408_15680 [Bacteroidetes bacterium]|nr:MAG: hypothetical protein C7N36_05510 [Bacteroidota bacterium]PTM10607.1 MAG: hypothetical protein DA408_15680 [Bacteroidota bacterium]
MDGQSTSLDFALISHQDSWEHVSAFLHAIRSQDLESMSIDKIKDIFSWIPPRKVFHVGVRSTYNGREVRGAYIESFIPPDQLQLTYFKKLVQKVQQASACAVREKAKIVTLGGFTSIILEGNIDLLPSRQGTPFTTGNTMTAALVVKGVEQACALHNISLSECNLLVIGSTGDIGSGCVNYFAGKVKQLLLCARRVSLLEEQSEHLKGSSSAVRFSNDPASLLPLADIVISVASTSEPEFSTSQCQPHTLICDVGYPKNILPDDQVHKNRLWHGGLGQITGGYYFDPDYTGSFYIFPYPNVGHGCLLEPVVLAMEERYESYSTDRGRITIEKIEEIWELSQKHGIVLAPFFNQEGVWQF